MHAGNGVCIEEIIASYSQLILTIIVPLDTLYSTVESSDNL